ncbi:uncharacterized protein L969DRAFT_102093 [Mixia osmundae IAM 14324]|uniref:Alpha-methylacyl-CoA racemase n=1 Tax=Mixia osmundae (strain CBS 9802 / IAM 14324 / JCM 22182 / KY 12970) TaxID=764103 RepID=G7E5Y6_MIXOS|nr:uncharacterized protein L969DRAFT_102093 [Mixia osmundae IAM 14324]KEI40603.1 hypothetical protein L969DRAFT_102093 [Mixia osmundae IAM 14324]GAA98246.1 hypothetical protein E5Q_04929 [Mixia osmundae IAM 14324]
MGRPLDGLTVLEFAGLAPGPFAGMVLADFGARVIRVDRPGTNFNSDTLCRGKESISISPKSASGKEILLDLIKPNQQGWKGVDVIIDPFRPGVLERLGLGPDVLLAANPGVVVARLTGYRRTGEYAKMAGHDINYIALSGVLSMLRPSQGKSAPFPPANLLGDFAGGGLMCVLGILLALIERTRSGQGQIVEADMITGTRYVSSFPLMLSKLSVGMPIWSEKAGDNVLDGGAPWYGVYETRDGKYMSVGAIESQFYEEFLQILIKSLLDSPPPKDSLTPTAAPAPSNYRYPSPATQHDRSTWPELRTFFTTAFATRTRDEWTSVFMGTDACVAPVLEKEEVSRHGVTIHEEAYGRDMQEEEEDEGTIPEPSPILSRTPARQARGQFSEGYTLEPGRDTREVLLCAGIDERMLDSLAKEGVISLADSDTSARSKL